MLTEEQISLLRPHWNDYPERRVVVPVYPQPRRKRGLKGDEQAALAADELSALATDERGSPLTTRFWTVFINDSAANSFIQRGSPRYVGPAMLHSFTGVWAWLPQATPARPIQLTFNSAPIPNSQLATWQMTPGSPVGDVANSWVNGLGYDPTPPTGLGHYQGASPNVTNHPLGIYIPLNEFYLGVSLWGAAATARQLMGTFRIIEGVKPSDVLGF